MADASFPVFNESSGDLVKHDEHMKHVRSDPAQVNNLNTGVAQFGDASYRNIVTIHRFPVCDGHQTRNRNLGVHPSTASRWYDIYLD